MSEIGMIGYSDTESVLLNALLSAHAVRAEDLFISNRTLDKLFHLQHAYPEIKITDNNQIVALQSDILFLCVELDQIKSVMDEIKPSLYERTHIIFLSAGLEIASVEQVYPGPITKIIPTLLAELHRGITLVCHNAKVSNTQSQYLENMLESIGKVSVISENQFEICANFTRCAPGLLAAICQHFIVTGIQHGDLSYELAKSLFFETLYGTAKLFNDKNIDLRDFIGQVATPGGSTEGGVSILDQALPQVFNDMFAAMLQRHEERKEYTHAQFFE